MVSEDEVKLRRDTERAAETTARLEQESEGVYKRRGVGTEQPTSNRRQDNRNRTPNKRNPKMSSADRRELKRLPRGLSV